MLKFLKKHRFYIITLIVAIVVLNLHVPYYVVAPGGTIDIGSRIKIDDEEKINGSLNLLYVSEYDGTVATLLVGFIMPNWDIHEIEDIQVADEDYNDIYITAVKDGLYGVINITTGKIIIDFKYNELHISGSAILTVQDNLLYPISTDEKYLLVNGYNYIYGYDNIYVVIKDKKLNILDNNEKTLIITPIEISEDYLYNDPTTHANIQTYQSENIIHILIKKDNEYIEYQYNIEDHKLTS